MTINAGMKNDVRKLEWDLRSGSFPKLHSIIQDFYDTKWFVKSINYQTCIVELVEVG